MRIWRRMIATIFLSGLATLTWAGEGADLTRTHLSAGTIAAGETALAARLAAQDDPETAFGLGVIRTIAAVERFGQALYRHGFEVRNGGMPLFRLPVPTNPTPERLDYAGMRAIFARLVTDLDGADAALARVGTARVELALQPATIRIDLSGTGQAASRETLATLLVRIEPAMGRIAPEAAARFTIRFDASDATWLRGYTRLVASIAEFWLAHDFSMLFDTSFHQLFPRAGLPGAAMLSSGGGLFGDSGWIADVIAGLHVARFAVVEPQRMAAIHRRLKEAIALSREMWRQIQAEPDGNEQWIPRPGQGSALGVEVTAPQIAAWLALLEELDAVLDGRKLIPHWRVPDRGINLRRVFLEPRPFDLVLWATGHAALPYLERGPLTDAAPFARADRAFGGNLGLFALWFN